MKTTFLTAIAPFGWIAASAAATTIDAIDRYAYGANLGWMDWTGGSGGTAAGAVIGGYVCYGLSVPIYTYLP
jgi:hypothetical protein